MWTVLRASLRALSVHTKSALRFVAHAIGLVAYLRSNLIGSRYGVTAIAAVMLIGAVGPATARSDRGEKQCEPRLDHPQSISIPSGSDYPVFGKGLTVEQVEFMLESGGSGCTFVVGFAGATARDGTRTARNGRHSLTYWVSDVRTGARRLRDRPAAPSTELLTVRFTGGQRRISRPYFVAVPAGQGAAPGVYRDTLTLSVYQQNGRADLRIESVSVALRITVPAAVEASLSTGHGRSPLGQASHTLDLGPLRTGLSRRFDLFVRANTGYTLTLSSGNGGALEGLKGREKSRIPYRLSADGRALDLKRTAHLARAAKTGREQHGFEVTVGSIERALSGDYQDTLRLTISAQ